MQKVLIILNNKTYQIVKAKNESQVYAYLIKLKKENGLVALNWTTTPENEKWTF